MLFSIATDIPQDQSILLESNLLWLLVIVVALQPLSLNKFEPSTKCLATMDKLP